MRRWTQQEINFLKENYENASNKELVKSLNRNKGSISYLANKLHLKKDYNAYCRSRKKYEKEFTKEIFKDLYLEKNKSIREIAKILGLGKNTVDYYLKKYKIKKRDKFKAARLRILKYPSWRKGLTKENDSRILAAAENAKITCDNKRKDRLKRIEEKFGKSIKELINEFYWKDSLNQEGISKKLDLPREKVIRLMKDFEISKRPNFEYIANLKGKDRPAYGKKWEEVYGLEKSNKMKREMSLRARKNIIKRLQNNEMPFLNTKIEKKMANELIKRKWPFYQQYVIDKRFVCDFALPLFNIIIECDGDYWHANPQIYDHSNLTKTQIAKVKRDKFKDLYLTKRNWKVFHFFESDIHKNFKNCINILDKEINEQLKSIKNPLDEL